MRIAILWNRLSGYFDACLRSLAALPDIDLFVSHRRSSATAPFSDSKFDWLEARYAYDEAPEYGVLRDRLGAFHPDAVLVGAWHVGNHQRVLSHFAASIPRILAMDNQWSGSPRQWLGRLAAPWYVRRIYDFVFLPGERQAQFARRLGFRDHEIWRGLYCADHDAYAAVFRCRRENRAAGADSFIYVGRLVAEKGVDVLAEGYRRYRESTGRTWPLTVCGEGPLRSQIESVEGVLCRGFVQPENLPSALGDATCLLLPSRFEPWGLVIHEATAAGLSVICSAACGASDHLVQDGYNGFVVEAGDANDLARALARYSAMDRSTIAEMAERSHMLSRQYTPQRWASYFHEHVRDAIERKLFLAKRDKLN